MHFDRPGSFRIVGRHIPALDGVRGIAILLVLIVHCVNHGRLQAVTPLDASIRSVASMGWIGVDLFFVLSGFLITGILLDTKADPRFFRVFYARRFLRIFPLYYGFLALWFFVVPRMADGSRQVAIPESEHAWYWTYLSNVRIAAEGWPDPGFLGHFWSLAIEEQFYLVWPLVVFVCSAAALRRVCWALIVLAPIVRVGLYESGLDLAAFVLTPARADVLAAGALLALLLRRGVERRRAVRAGWTLLVAGGIPMLALFAARGRLNHGDDLVATVGMSAVAAACSGLVLLAVVSSERGRLSRALTAGWLILLGQLSYGLYVVHQPVIIGIAKYGFNARTLPRVYGSQVFALFSFSLTAIAISLVLAYASWHLYEKRFLALKRLVPYRRDARRGPSAPPREAVAVRSAPEPTARTVVTPLSKTDRDPRPARFP